MNIEKLELSVAASDHITNTYLVYDETGDGILIDPADEAERIISKIEELNLNIKYIILTHGHFDHTNGLCDMVKYTNAKVLIHKDDIDMLFGKVDDASSMFNAVPKYINENEVDKIEDGYTFSVGNMEFEIIHTPGHTAGSIIIYEKISNVIFSGDTLFAKSHGRCDLETGSMDSMVTSLRKIFNKFEDEEIIVYPGHGENGNLKRTEKYIKLLLALRKIEL